MPRFTKLRHRLATFLLALGNAVESRRRNDDASSATQVCDSEPQPRVEHDREAAVRALLACCAQSFRGRDRHVRANMMTFSPDRSRRRVHAATAYNMEGDPDRDLEIGATASASGKAVVERRAAVADLVLLQITAVPAWGLQASEQARVRPTLKSILSAPIFNPHDIDGPLLGTLQVDSDLTVEDAGFDRAESCELLQQFADILSLLLIGVQVRIGCVKVLPAMRAPRGRVHNASQVEPGLYVANRSTSIFQPSRTGYS
jgi:hypothetical protein